MLDLLLWADQVTTQFAQAGAILVLAAGGVVVVERAGIGGYRLWRQRIERRLDPIVQRALSGDEAAWRDLATSPSRHRIIRDVSTLQAVVVRLNDQSLHRGRRIATVAAFGRECEPFLLELAAVDSANRDTYTRALAICGTERSRPTLSLWTQDPRAQVRAGAFEALGHVGLDRHAASLAIDALEGATLA